MNGKNLPPALRHLIEGLFIAGLYYLTARLGFLMALPPGNVTALWIPSGLALASILIFGWHSMAGIFAGSLLVNWGSLSGQPASSPAAAAFGTAIFAATAMFASAAIAAGSTLQAGLAAGLLRRFIKKFPPDSVPLTLLAIGITALATLLAPSVGVTSLCLAGFAGWSSFFQLFWTWWMGDFIGVMVFMPIPVVLAMRRRKLPVFEPFLWSLTCFIIGAALFSFFVIYTEEQNHTSQAMRADAAEMVNVLQKAIDQHETQAITALPAFYSAVPLVNREQFRSFTGPFLKNFPAMSAISWVDYVPQPERAAYEQSVRREGIADFTIFEKDASGNNIAALERPEYFPVTFIEPLAGNKAALGFDNGSNPERLAALRMARDSGEPVVTAPVQLVQDFDKVASILIFMPVYRSGAPTQSVAERRANLEGLVVGVFRVSALVKSALGEMKPHDIAFYLYDIADPGSPQFLTFYPSQSGPQYLPAKGAPEPAELQTGIYQTSIIKIGSRDWLVVTRPGPRYASGSNGWLPWASMVVGILLAGGFLSYFSSHQKARASLARSEAEFRNLSEAALTGVLRMKPAGEIIYANRAMAQMVGLEQPEGFIHANIRSFLSNPAEFDALDQAFGSTGQIRNEDLEILTTSGEKRQVIYSARLLEGVISATVVDLSERIRAEREIRQLSRVVAQMADTVMITDMDGVIQYVNPAFEELTGYSRAEVIGANPRILKSGVQDQAFYSQMWETILSGKVFRSRITNRKKNGELYLETKTITPLRDADGKITSFVATGKDITERQQMEEALHKREAELEELNRDLEKRVEERTAEVRQSEATYRALFEKSNDGIFLISPAGVEIQANQRALDMLGYTFEEYKAFTAQSKNPMVPVEQRADADARFAAVLRGEHVPLYERTFTRKDGTPVQAEINLSAVRDAEGKVILVQSVVRDITERKKAEESLRDSRDKLSAANAALEKASRLKDEFLASMSHELRTPLTGILGLSEALQLQTYGPLNDRQLKSVRTIESSGRHLLELINDILDLSKIEAGKLDLQIELCSIAEICQASLQLIKGMAHQKKQNVSFSMNPVSITLNVDARRMKQMLVNLLSNAVKFTAEGGKLGLEVAGSEEEGLVRLTVWDMGIGIRPEDMGKLFKPFVQLDSSLSRQYAGTGLGLSLVQRMAELHGGSIQVVSVYGEGSRFTILLPWQNRAEEPAAGPEKPAAAALKDTMVIEDNTLDADQVARYLKGLGIDNFIHPVVQGALEKAAARHPSAILLDLNLPDGFGLDLLRQLKADERTRGIPVVIISVEERRPEARQLGAAGYLVKPFSQQDLHAELAKAAAHLPPGEPVMVITPASAHPLVMIADDNEVILDMISSFLEANAYRVFCVRSGFELLERAPELHPDIILMDIQMPGLDGMETTRRVRAHKDPALAQTPIIAITALAMAGDREKCLEAGVNEYMSKPVVLTQLVEKMKALLQVKAVR